MVDKKINGIFFLLIFKICTYVPDALDVSVEEWKLEYKLSDLI